MYEIATKNHNTTLDLNPPGGSENFHEGPGGWNSGNGWGTLQMNQDWRYSDERMDVRTQGLNILLKKFGSQICSDGSPRYSNQSIYECIHDWVSQGNVNTSGLVKYYEAYYA